MARALNEHRESHCYPRYSRRTAPVMQTDMHKSSLKAKVMPGRAHAFPDMLQDLECCILLRCFQRWQSQSDILMVCRHPSKDSQEYRQLLGLGRAAAAYGQTTAARQLYEVAGAWSELLSLCALQGDFMSVRDYMQSV